MAFVLTRQNWRRIDGGVYRLPGAVEVAAFDSAAEAAGGRDDLAADFRGRVNPFAWGDGLFDITRLAPFALADWLTDADLTPPPADAPRAEWVEWWAGAEPDLSPAQRGRAWQAFDKLDVYAVEEAADRPSVWVALSVPWQFDDYRPGSAALEGGDVIGTYRSAAAALAAGAAWEDAEADDPDEYDVRDVAGRRAFVSDPGIDPPAVVLGRSVPRTFTLPVPSAPGRGPLFVVGRYGWSSAVHRLYETVGGPRPRREVPFRRWDGPRAWVPVAAFDTREAAGRDRWDRELEARPYLNPFRFGPPTRVTTLNEPGYRAMLGDLGLDLPLVDWGFGVECQHAWAAWWERVVGLLTRDQQETAWDLLDGLGFYTVRELVVTG